MRTRIVRIGNSQGVRIPKPLLEEAGIEGEVELRVRKGSIVIEPASRPRSGWEEAAQALAAEQAGAGAVLDGAVPTAFDDEEWEWVEEPAGEDES